MALKFPRTRDFLWYWLPPVAWCGVVLILSGDLGSGKNTLNILKWLLSWLPPLSPAQIDQINFYFRKSLGHFGNYALVYFLWFRALRSWPGYPPGRACLWSLALSLGLALLDEGHQAMLPASRGSSLQDVAVDLGGSAVAALAVWIFWTRGLRRWPRMSKARRHRGHNTDAIP